MIYKGGGVPSDSSKTETKPDGTTVEKEVDGAVFILKGDKTPTSIGGELQQFSLGGSPISSKIKPPADCRGAQMYYVMQSMTRTSQQVRRGVLENRRKNTDGRIRE